MFLSVGNGINLAHRERRRRGDGVFDDDGDTADKGENEASNGKGEGGREGARAVRRRDGALPRSLVPSFLR